MPGILDGKEVLCFCCDATAFQFDLAFSIACTTPITPSPFTYAKNASLFGLKLSISIDSQREPVYYKYCALLN